MCGDYGVGRRGPPLRNVQTRPGSVVTALPFAVIFASAFAQAAFAFLAGYLTARLVTILKHRR